MAPGEHQTTRARSAGRAVTPTGDGAGQPRPSGRRVRFGRFGEDCAATWYRRHGYAVAARNWRCPGGELDLVVVGPTVVVFVEVKARSGAGFGSGAEAVDARKQARVRAAARRWLAEHRGGYFDEVRFDVVDVDRRGNLQVYQGCF